MAEIKVEKKTSVWPWVIGVIVLLLIIWALFALFNRDNDTVANTPATVAAPAAVAVAPATSSTLDTGTPPLATTGSTGMPGSSMGSSGMATDNPVTVGSIVTTPADFAGQQVAVSGTVRVAKVPTDRGFWIEDNGQRIFAVIAQSPGMENAVDVTAGQKVKLMGTVQNQPAPSDVSGNLDPQARQIIDNQPVFLLVPANAIMVLGS